MVNRIGQLHRVQVRRVQVRRVGSTCLGIVLAAACLTSPASAASRHCQDPQGESSKLPPASRPTSRVAVEKPLVSGRLSSRYYLRHTARASDNDLYETLTLDVGDPNVHPVTGHFMGRLAADLDGHAAKDSPFFSIEDSYGGSITGRVYDAYVDVHTISELEVLRGGRQYLYDTPETVMFDGVLAETKPIGKLEAKLGGYAGITNHLYENSHSGDWTVGAFAEGKPWTGSWGRLDWMHLEDDRRLGPNRNDLLSARLNQRIARRFGVDGRYTMLEGESRDVDARVSYDNPESDSMLQARYYQLLETQKSLVLELDPFYELVYELFPYQQASFLASQGVMGGKGSKQHVTLEAGADLRRVSHKTDVGQFNRDYDRYHMTLRLEDLFVEGMTISMTGDVWNSNGQAVRSANFDISQRVAKDWTVSGGTYFSLYKFDLYLSSERDNVRTYFAKVRHEASKSLVFSGSYELEDADFGTYQVLILEAVWRF